MLESLKGQVKVGAAALFDVGANTCGFEGLSEVRNAFFSAKRECLVNVFRASAA
jgi:hypothetical protein